MDGRQRAPPWAFQTLWAMFLPRSTGPPPPTPLSYPLPPSPQDKKKKSTSATFLLVLFSLSSLVFFHLEDTMGFAETIVA